MEKAGKNKRGAEAENERESMKKVVFDSFALIALFRKEQGYVLVRDLLVQIAKDELEGYISAINVGEIYYMISRKSTINNAEIAIAALKQMPLQIIEPDLKMCLSAATIKAKYSISYADAFAAQLTIQQKAVLISGDDEFNFLSEEPGFKVKYL